MNTHLIRLAKNGCEANENSSEGADTAEDVRADQINTVLPRFNPGKQFKRTLDTIEFSKN
jgi:hypothetical protein